MATFAVGDVLAGKYEIKAVLGAGGMGTVYRARQIDLGRDVAIKIPNPQALDVPGFRTRFSREAKLVARLVHDNIVQVYEYTESDDAIYIVMEYVEGTDLKAMIMKPPLDLTVRDVATILRASCEGLAHAHEMGIVHRDIKPHNIMVERRGKKWRVKIMDFGIAHMDESTANMTMNHEQLTVTGQAIGTPSYMSPEQIRGTGVTAQSDIYSFGCVAYYAFTKQTPFVGTGFTVAASHLSELPPPIRTKVPGIPPALEAIVNRCLQKDPALRPGDCSELGQEIFEALMPIADLPMTKLWPGPDQEGSGSTDVLRPTAQLRVGGELDTVIGGAGATAEAATVIVGNPGVTATVDAPPHPSATPSRPAPPPANPAALDPHLSDATMAYGGGTGLPQSPEFMPTPVPQTPAKGRNPLVLGAMIGVPVMLLGITLVAVIASRKADSSGPEVADLPTPTVTVVPRPEQTPAPTATPDPALATPAPTPTVTVTPTPVPTPTPDPVLLQVETLRSRFDNAAQNLQARAGIWRTAVASPEATDPRVVALIDDMSIRIARTPEMVRIAGGTKTVGADGSPDAFPPANVRLSTYEIGRYEVTALEFSAFLNAIGDEGRNLYRPAQDSTIIYDEATSRFRPAREKELHPANYVTWEAAERYTRWLSSETKRDFRLPTETQWEVAARGGTTQAYPWGDSEPSPTLANFHPSIGLVAVTEFASGSNRLNGIMHAAGNASEWCADWYRSDYSPSSQMDDPTGPASGGNPARRVLRGGAYNSMATELPSYYRDSSAPTNARPEIGFRLALIP